MSDTTPDPQPVDDAGTAAASEEVDTQAMLQALAASVAYLPQEGLSEGETPPEGAIAIPVIEQDGTQYVPVFTSEEALVTAGASPQSAVGLPLAELAANWPDDALWLAINPGSEGALTLPPEGVQALAAFAQGQAAG